VLLTAPDHPRLDMNADRGVADTNHFGVDANDIADINRLLEAHGVDGDGYRAALGDFVSEDAAGDVHLAEQPPAENIAVLIRVAGHCQHADRSLAARRRRCGSGRRWPGTGCGSIAHNIT